MSFAQAYFVKSQILRRMNLIPHALISILIGLFFEPCRTLESEHLKQVSRGFSIYHNRSSFKNINFKIF